MTVTFTKDKHGSHTVEELVTCECSMFFFNPPSTNHSSSIKIRDHFESTAFHTTSYSWKLKEALVKGQQLLV